MANPEPKSKDNNENAANNYARYTGIIFQMIAIIGLFAAIGYWIDNKLKHDTPLVTATTCLLGVGLSLYQTIRQLSK